MATKIETPEQRAAFNALRAAGIEAQRAAEMAVEQNPPADPEPPREPPAPDPPPASGASSPEADALPGAAEIDAAIRGLTDRVERLEGIARAQGWTV